MDEQTTLNEENQFIISKLDDEYYGMDISLINSIIRMTNITRVPKSQDFFEGVINLRGEIIPVMNLRSKFELDKAEVTKNTRIVIVKLESKYSVGIILDNVLEVIRLDNDNIVRPITDDEDGANKYIYGIGKYNGKLISLIDLSKLILE